MHRSSSPLIAAAVILFSLATAQCQRQAPPAHPVRRVGTAGDLGFEPPVAFRRFRLFDTTREIARVAPVSSHSVPIEAGTGAVAFAYAVTAEGENPVEVEFRLILEAGGERRVLFHDTARSDAGDWHERVVPLGLGANASPARLFLETEPGASARGRLVRPFWGSILLLGEPAPATAAGTRPRFDNVVLVSLDTLGAAYTDGFGDGRGLTPAMDALRARGFAFLRAYANYPSTRPSHASMLSGFYPRRHLAFGLKGAIDVRMISDDLSAAGFHTAALTEDGYIASVFGFDRGFDSYSDGFLGFAGDADRTFDRATRWLQRAGLAEHRFFLFVHTYEVHSPYVANDEGDRALVEKLDPGYSGPHRFSVDTGPFEAPHNSGESRLSQADLRRFRALYRMEVRRQDEILGRFAAALAALPGADRTLLVVTSDHGEEFGEQGFIGHGPTLHNRALHVPLLFVGAGLPVGESDEVVQLVDLAPTILDLVGLPAVREMDGRSLVPLLDGRPWEPRAAIAESAEQRAAQTRSFKLVRSSAGSPPRLYHLGRDAAESRDVAAEFPGEMEALARTLAEYDALIPPAGEAAAPELDPDTRERLRVLGYAE